MPIKSDAIKRSKWDIDDLSFDAVTSLHKRLRRLYESVELETLESMPCVTCRKGEENF